MTGSKIISGLVAGLIAGVVFGVLMQMMTAPTPDGKQIPMMQMVAMVVRSDDLVVGWLYHLFNSAVIGATFGWVSGTALLPMAPDYFGAEYTDLYGGSLEGWF